MAKVDPTKPQQIYINAIKHYEKGLYLDIQDCELLISNAKEQIAMLNKKIKHEQEDIKLKLKLLNSSKSQMAIWKKQKNIK